MTIRNLSPATQQSYLYAVARFSRHFESSPDLLGTEHVRAYQLHLVTQKYSWTHINQVACALRFFYGVTLGQKDALERIVFGREPEKLTPVLARLAGREISRDVIGRLKRLVLIDGALRAPERGGPFAYVTTWKFGPGSLRELPDLERLEDEGLLQRPGADGDLDRNLGLRDEERETDEDAADFADGDGHRSAD